VAIEGADYGRTLTRLARQLEIALGDVGLSLPQYRILGILGEGSSGASALAEKLTVSRPTVTAAVDGLVARGLVARSPDGQDRRRIHHTLTTEGELVLVQANQAVRDRLTDIVGYLPIEEQAAAFAGFELWRSALDLRRDARRAARA
jgi:long-chain acyl-CoA synthetase